MARIITLPCFSDDRGALTVIEKVLPFEIKRLYWIYDVKPGQRRGGHRHKKTQQAMICLNGGCEVEIINASAHSRIQLSNPNDLLILPPEDWHEMINFQPNTVLLLLASHYFDKDDYLQEPIQCKSAMKI